MKTQHPKSNGKSLFSKFQQASIQKDQLQQIKGGIGVEDIVTG